MTESNVKSPELIEMEERFAKMKRRETRNLRAAHAQGLLEGICSMLRPSDVVLDCGANVGSVTLRLAATGANVRT